MNRSIKDLQIVLRVFCAFALVGAYVYVYFPFAAAVSRRSGIGILLLSLFFMGIALIGCICWLKPRTKSGWLAFWLCVLSWLASLIGIFFLLLPQSGHPSIGIFFLLTPIGVNVFLIPLTLFLFAVCLIRRERVSIVVSGFLYLIAASFFFSSIRFQIPPALDYVSNTNWFSQMARRLDVEFTDSERPNYNEMTNDIILTKKGPLTESKLYHLNTTAAKAPQYRCRIIEELIREFPTAKEFELQRRVIMEIDLQYAKLRPEDKCGESLIMFYHNTVNQRNADVSDLAARFLTLHFFDQILSEDRYQIVAETLAQYALERQLNPQPAPKTYLGKFYLQKTFDCIAELDVAASKLAQSSDLGDKKAAKNLSLFLPYLSARQTNTCRNCTEVATKIRDLQIK